MDSFTCFYYDKFINNKRRQTRCIATRNQIEMWCVAINGMKNALDAHWMVRFERLMRTVVINQFEASTNEQWEWLYFLFLLRRIPFFALQLDATTTAASERKMQQQIHLHEYNVVFIYLDWVNRTENKLFPTNVQQ